MKTSNQLFLVRDFKFYFAVIVLSLAVILFSGCQSDPASPLQIPSFPTPTIAPNIPIDIYQEIITDPVIKLWLDRIDRERQEFVCYLSQGESRNGLLLNISLALSGLASSFIAIIVGAKLWGKTGRRGLWLLLGLSIFVAANSGVGAFLKMQHDAFFDQNRSQYANLADDIYDIIEEFDSKFAADAEAYTSGDSDIAELREQIESDAKSALGRIEIAKREYRDKFNIPVVCW